MTVYLDSEKSFFKANLHTHSTNSDGRATPEKIKEEYMARGYSVVAFTDHEHITSNYHLSDDKFIAITGAELAISGEKRWDPPTKQNGISVHVNVYAMDPENVLTPYASRDRDRFGPDEVRAAASYDEMGNKRIFSHEGISDFVREAHERGFLVSLNHPEWSLINATHYLGYDGFDFVEIHNTGAEKTGHGGDERAFFDMIRAGKNVFCTAADDNHNIHGFDDPRSDSFGGWVMINAERLEYSEIMNALKCGNFYASQGPEIYSLTREGDKVTIKTSPVRAIYRQTEGRRVIAKLAEEGEYLTEATFALDELERIFRIRIEDEHGKCAYTQSYSVAISEN